MAKKKIDNFNVSVMPDEVMYTNISTSKDGYNSARMVIKKGDKEYMSISYEWEGGTIPGFAMDLMGFMKNSGQESSGVWEGHEEAYEELSAKKKGFPPWLKKGKYDEEDDDKKKDKKKDDKKKDKKKK